MDNHNPAPSLHHHVPLPTIASLVRLLPLTLLFFFTTPHNLAENIHAIYTRRPYLKPAPRDPFPSKRGDINLNVIPLPLGIPSRRAHIILQPGTSLYAALSAPELCSQTRPCAALLETWYDHNLPRELKPDPYFLAADGDVPQPFPHFPSSRLADDEAFLVWRPYHYLHIPHILASDDWHLRILNHDSTVFNVLNATLRVTIAQSNTSFPSSPPVLCPSGAAGSPCSAHGRCKPPGVCLCSDGWGGRYCQTPVLPLPDNSVEVPPDAMHVFKFVTSRRASVATVLELLSPRGVSPAAHPILFAKRPGANGGQKLRTGPPLPTIYDLAFTDGPAIQASLPVQHVVTSDVPKGGVVLIGVYNFHSTAPAWLIRRHPNRRMSEIPRRRSVRVRVRAYACDDTTELTHDGRMVDYASEQARDAVGDEEDEDDEDDDAVAGGGWRQARRRQQRGEKDGDGEGADVLRICPPRSANYWDLSLRYMLFPVVLGFVTLVTLVVCVSVWAGVFRQHMLDTLMGPADAAGGADGQGGDRTWRRDKLSEVEVNAMFPAFEFTKGETDALCAVGDASCSVCLCAFEEGEMLRRLACGHSYHSECLDRWLLTNATCPRCRKAARIRGEVFRSGAALRRTVRVAAGRVAAAWAWLHMAWCVTLCGGGDEVVDEHEVTALGEGDTASDGDVDVRRPVDAAEHV